MAEDALVVALCAYVDNNEDIPVPEAATEGQVMVAVPPIVAAKFALYTAMRKQGITAEELAVIAWVWARMQSARSWILATDHT